MKRISILSLLFVFMVVPPVINAHTYLSSSNPENGQIVTSELQEIILEFKSEVENLSTFELFKVDEEIEMEDILIES